MLGTSEEVADYIQKRQCKVMVSHFDMTSQIKKQADGVTSKEVENIPIGWKIKLVEETVGRKRLHLWSPCGKMFWGTISALKWMIKEKHAEKDIQVMATHLEKSGWKIDPKLPRGWHFKIMKGDSDSSK